MKIKSETWNKWRIDEERLAWRKK